MAGSDQKEKRARKITSRLTLLRGSTYVLKLMPIWLLSGDPL